MSNKKLRIVFMGTPGFAVESLRAVINKGYTVAGVVTAPDRPAGRGQKQRPSPVKKYASEQGLTILQPDNLKSPEFLKELKALKANLFVVVAFRMLPEVVWKMPGFGTFNLHASLLPQYRGAAPVNWAIINGEKESGVTTFFIDDKIDTGNIIRRKKVNISKEDTAGSLHDKLMHQGADLLIRTIEDIEKDNIKRIPQDDLLEEGEQLHTAPKIFKKDCEINWKEPGRKIYDFIRGMSPFPTAWTELIHKETGEKIPLKVFFARFENTPSPYPAGKLFDYDNSMGVAVKDGIIKITELQQAGKKRMKTTDFLRGFNIGEYAIIEKQDQTSLKN